MSERLRLVTSANDAPERESRLEDLEDDDLVRLARGGRREAFETLVRRHQAKVLGFATKFLGSQAAAFDAAQEAFCDVLRALPRYQPQGRFSAFLVRCTLNRCRMQTRSRM